MGVHPTGIALMAPKAVVEPLRLVGVRAPGANIIKQEMLAMGRTLLMPKEPSTAV